MRAKDVFDTNAELWVFSHKGFRSALESGDDARLAEVLAGPMRDRWGDAVRTAQAEWDEENN